MQLTNHVYRHLLALCFVCLPGMAFAQSSVIFKVIDESADRPVDFSSIQLNSDKHQYYGLTDSTGIFRFMDVAAGTYTVTVQHLSFSDLVIASFVVGKNEHLVKELNLKASSTELGAVEITANQGDQNVRNKFATVSARHITAEQIEQYPGTFKDPARMAMSGAGIAASGSEEKNELVIRGNSSRGMAWYIEGIPVPSPNHFSDEGASNGSVSMVSANNILGADLYTGAFPAEFGNATAGVFSLEMRNGDLNKTKYGFEIGPIGIDARMEGPLKKEQSSFILNYRYSTFALLEKAGVDIKGLQTPKYQDVNYKLHFKLNDKTTLNVFGVNGGSHFGKESTAEVNGNDMIVRKYTEGYSLFVDGFTIKHQLNSRWTINTTMAYVGNIIRGEAQELNDSLTAFEEDGFQSIRYHSAKAHGFVEYQKGTKTIQSGIYATHTSFGISLGDDFKNQKPTEKLKDNDQTYELAYYIAGKMMLSPQVMVTGGLHAMYHYLTRNFVAEPRIGLKYFINEVSEVSYSSGLHSTFESPITYLGEIEKNGITFQPNRFLKPMRALHNVVGYTLRVKTHTHFHVEAYHQYLFKVPVKADNETGYSTITKSRSFIKDKMNNDGVAWNYGVEFSVNQFLPKQFFITANVSVFDAKYIGSNGKKYNSRYNNNGVSNLIVGKKFNVGKDKKNSIITGVRLAMGGGLRYSPIDEAASYAKGEAVEDDDHWFNERGPMFYRIDLGMMYKISREKIKINIKLDIQNLTNAERVANIEFDPKYGQVLDKQGQILPAFFVEFQF